MEEEHLRYGEVPGLLVLFQEQAGTGVEPQNFLSLATVVSLNDSESHIIRKTPSVSNYF
jgi:hypothetical protein